MFEKGKYDVEYMRANVLRKHLTFNKNNPEDMELLRFAESKGNFNAFVKQLIRDALTTELTTKE